MNNFYLIEDIDTNEYYIEYDGEFNFVKLSEFAPTLLEDYKAEEIYKFLKKDYNYNVRIIEVKLILGKEVK